MKIDQDGNIVRRLTSETFGFFSQAVEYGNHLIIGRDRDRHVIIVENVL